MLSTLVAAFTLRLSYLMLVRRLQAKSVTQHADRRQCCLSSPVADARRARPRARHGSSRRGRENARHHEGQDDEAQYGVDLEKREVHIGGFSMFHEEKSTDEEQEGHR